MNQKTILPESHLLCLTRPRGIERCHCGLSLASVLNTPLNTRSKFMGFSEDLSVISSCIMWAGEQIALPYFCAPGHQDLGCAHNFSNFIFLFKAILSLHTGFPPPIS